MQDDSLTRAPKLETRVRLAKLLAQRGVAARRKAEELIAAGKVTVNGKVAEVVTFVDPQHDIVMIAGKPLPAEAPHVYYLMYKPAGYITSRDPQGGRSAFDLVAHLHVRVEPVGRLDADSEGALLLTNDGRLAHALTHPSREVPKRYLAVVEGAPGQAVMSAIDKGVPLDDGPTAPAKARVIRIDARGNARVEITVTEGRNRLVRRMMLSLGHPVLKLLRQSFAGITVRGMKAGEVRALTASEVSGLRAMAERTPVPKRKGGGPEGPLLRRKRKGGGPEGPLLRR